MTDVTVFLFSLTQLQDVYTRYLRYNFFIDLERINTFDENVDLNWFSDSMTEYLRTHLKQVMGTSKGLTYDLIFDQLDIPELVYFMNE